VDSQTFYRTTRKLKITIFFPQIYSTKTYDFRTLYTTIPHDKSKTRLFGIIDSCFFNKNSKRKYSYLVVNYLRTYFVIHDSDSTHKYSEVDIKEMLGFLINNIFVVFGNQIFQQTVGIPMGTNCAPLLADLFLYSYEAKFILKNFYMRKTNLLLWPSIQHLYTSTMFYRSATISSIHMSILYTPVNLKLKTLQNHLLLLHTWTFC
jgi:hypothetical protein